MGGAPVFSVFRETFPLAELTSIKGIFNATTNVILTLMENGEAYDDAVKYAQSIGLAETDPTNDVDGWDSLSHVNLILAIETKFTITFSQKELLTFRNVGDLYKSIEKKLESRK